jgi:hypothetical protein
MLFMFMLNQTHVCDRLLLLLLLLLLQGGGVPWKEHLFDLEQELQVDTPIL